MWTAIRMARWPAAARRRRGRFPVVALCAVIYIYIFIYSYPLLPRLRRGVNQPAARSYRRDHETGIQSVYTACSRYAQLDATPAISRAHIDTSGGGVCRRSLAATKTRLRRHRTVTAARVAVVCSLRLAVTSPGVPVYRCGPPNRGPKLYGHPVYAGPNGYNIFYLRVCDILFI